MWPRDDKERKQLMKSGNEKDSIEFLWPTISPTGKNIIFCATGISDSALLAEFAHRGTRAITHSILMRAKSKTVRFIRATHDLQYKTIRLRSDNREHTI